MSVTGKYLHCLTIFVVMMNLVSSLPTGHMGTATDVEESPVPVDFVTILVNSVNEKQYSDQMLVMPANPPEWLINLIERVSASKRPFSNRQKRQINIQDPAVQDLLRAYYKYCLANGIGTVQVRLGRSVGSQMPERTVRSRRSTRRHNLKHILRHPSFLKLLKKTWHLRGRKTRSPYHNAHVMRILQRFYMKQKKFGTSQARFG